MKKRLLVSVLALGLTGANTQAQQLTDLRRGFTLFQLERYDDAARVWQQDARAFIAEANNLENQRAAGLANVLATIAYEQANDDKAYQTWAEAVRHFLYGNTRWTDERVALKGLYEEQVQELTIPEPVVDPAVNPEDIPNQDANLIDIEPESQVLDENVLFFLEVELALAVSEYDGPAPGLQRQRTYSLTSAPVEEAEPIDDGRVFISRPSFYANRRPENLSETVIAQRPAPRIKVDEDAIRRDSQNVGSRAMFYVSQPDAEETSRNFASAPLTQNSRSNFNRDERNQYRRSQPRIVASTIARENARALASAQARTNADDDASLFIPHRGMGQLTRAIAQSAPPQQPALLPEQIALEQGLDINELPATAASQEPEAKPMRFAIKPTHKAPSREPSYTPEQEAALFKEHEESEAVTLPLIAEAPKLIRQLEAKKLADAKAAEEDTTASQSQSKLENALAASKKHSKVQESVSLTGRNIELDLALMSTEPELSTKETSIEKPKTEPKASATRSEVVDTKSATKAMKAEPVASLDNKEDVEKPILKAPKASLEQVASVKTKKTKVEKKPTKEPKVASNDNKTEKKVVSENKTKKLKSTEKSEVANAKAPEKKSSKDQTSKLSLLADSKDNKKDETRFLRLSGKEKAEVERKKKVLEALELAQELQDQPEHYVDAFYIPAIAHRSGWPLNPEEENSLEDSDEKISDEFRNNEEYDQFIASQEEFELPDFSTFVVHAERAITHLQEGQEPNILNEEYEIIDYEASDFGLAFVHAQRFLIDDPDISLAGNYKIETPSQDDTLFAANTSFTTNLASNNTTSDLVEQFAFAPLFLEALTTPTAAGIAIDSADLNEQLLLNLSGEQSIWTESNN